MAFKVWLQSNPADVRDSDATDAETAADEVTQDLVAEGKASILGEGCSFDVLTRDEGDDEVMRFRVHSPPAFVLDQQDCCRACGASDDDDPEPQWISDDLCSKCGEASEAAA